MKSKLTSAARSAGMLFVQFLCTVLIGAILLSVAYAIPAGRVEQNVKVSAEKIADEGCYPNLFTWCTSQLDNYTDSIMMLEAAHDDGDNPIINAMESEYGQIDDLTPYDTLIAHYTSDAPFTEQIAYSRYWHGYLIFVKPLLYFTDYINIRYLNSALQVMLVGLFVFLLWRKNQKKYILPVLLIYALLMPAVLAQSLQFSTCFYIALIGSILLIAMKNRVNKTAAFCSLFLFLGTVTSYFDLLTYPIFTFCFPFALYLCLFDDPRSLICSLLNFVKMGFCWVFGYAGMWATKWVIGSAVLNKNLFTDALGQAGWRTASTTEGQSTVEYIIRMLKWNVSHFINSPVLILMILFVLIAFALLVAKKVKTREPFFTAKAWTIIILHVIVALLPVAWYLVLSNHSYVHSWFTYKSMAGSAVSVMLLSVRLLPKS